MKHTIFVCGTDHEAVYLELPASVLKALGWNDNDELTLDIPMTGEGVLMVTKKVKHG